MTRRGLAVAMASFILAASSARAAGAAKSATLVYVRGPGASSCPGESELRQAIAARVGYDPFLPAAPLTILVEVTAEGGALRGRIVLGTGGIEKGAQTIDGARRPNDTASCEDLVASIALAVSVALDADGTAAAAAPAKPPEVLPKPPEEAAAPVPTPASPLESRLVAAPVAVAPASSRGRIALWVALGPRFSLGDWPVLAVAPDLFAELRSGRLGLGIEGRYDATLSPVTVGAGEQASVQKWTGSIVPCAHIDWFVPCAVATFGETRAQGDNVAGATTATSPYVAMGGRLGVDVKLVTRFHLLGTLDVVGVATPTRIQVGSNTATSGPVEGSAEIALLVSIF